jgi:acyl carrier protein
VYTFVKEQEAINLVEQQVLEIFQTVLGHGSIGLDDDFLDAGGDSLAAMRCISRIRTVFGVEPTIEDFFMGDATVRSIAAQIKNDNDAQA